MEVRTTSVMVPEERQRTLVVELSSCSGMFMLIITETGVCCVSEEAEV